jgi:SAM-dependent methyltransferase
LKSLQLGYSVRQFKDADAEVVRLERQASFIADTEDRLLTALGLPAAGRMLDLGCGPGAPGARIRAGRPELEVVGLDRDAGLLALARTKLRVVQADAAELPFPSSSFDAVHVRLLLRHMAHPATVLAEIHRVLRPGGRLVLGDTDDGALVLDPFPGDIARALAAKHETARRRGADPFIGRRLPALVRAAGFSRLTVRAQAVDSGALGRSTFGEVVLSPIAEAIDSDLLAAADSDRTAGAIRRWIDDAGAFGMTTFVSVGGTRD